MDAATNFIAAVGNSIVKYFLVTILVDQWYPSFIDSYLAIFKYLALLMSICMVYISPLFQFDYKVLLDFAYFLAVPHGGGRHLKIAKI